MILKSSVAHYVNKSKPRLLFHSSQSLSTQQPPWRLSVDLNAAATKIPQNRTFLSFQLLALLISSTASLSSSLLFLWNLQFSFFLLIFIFSLNLSFSLSLSLSLINLQDFDKQKSGW